MSSKEDERLSRAAERMGMTVEELKAAAAPGEPVYDEDNPPLTPKDWEKMHPIEELPADELAVILAAFPKTKLRGPQRTPTKVPVSLRLSREVVDHYKATGDGWQTRIDDALKDLIKKAG